LDEDVLVRSLLVRVHLVFYLVHGEDQALYADVFKETFYHCFEDVLRCFAALPAGRRTIFRGYFQQSVEEGIALRSSEADF